MATLYPRAFDELRNLSAEAAAGQLLPTLHRAAEAEQCKALLAQGHSLVVVGPEGAGKSSLLQLLAGALAAEKTELRQLAAGDLVTGTSFLGEWQTKTRSIIDQAIARRAVLLITDASSLRSTGSSAGDRSNAWDLLRPHLESGRLRLCTECTAERLRDLLALPGALGVFHQVSLLPLSAAQVAEVVSARALARGLALPPESLAALIQLSSRFLPARTQPAPALTLLEQVVDYRAQKQAIGEPEPPAPALIERVLSVYSGLPRFIVSRSESMPVAALRDWFRERIIGQAAAIEAVVETITLFKAGLHDPARPIGSLLFVGPTGVGKTEVARALSRFLFGSEARLLRLDMSEYKDWDSYQQLIGVPGRPELGARLLDPVRAQPFQVILLDELEKAHGNVLDLLLQLLDDGRLSPPGGEAVSFKNTIVIATSNAGAGSSDAPVGFGGGGGGGEGDSGSLRRLLAREFRPEFLNRFAHVVRFHPLSRAEVRAIARQELARILAREGIAERRLVVDVAEGALDQVIDRSFDPHYGARGLKRDLARQIVVPLATTLVERDLAPGTVVRVVPDEGRLRVRVVETEDSREHRRQQAPVASAAGKLSRAEAQALLAGLQRQVHELAERVDVDFLAIERRRIEELRQQPDFWRDSAYVAQTLRDLDRITATLERIDNLGRFGSEIAAGLAGDNTRNGLALQVRAIERMSASLAAARRELLTIGRAGDWDALVEVRPVGARARPARDLLVQAYLGWAHHRGAQVDWLADPTGDDQAAFFAVRGGFVAGYLGGETGLHRLRQGEALHVAAVRVAPWTDDDAAPAIDEERALKGVTGQFGTRVRSRLRFCRPGEGVLQNARTLDDNRELARLVSASWGRAPEVGEAIVRRYDEQPFLVRDTLLGWSSGRPDALSPEPLHALLCQRVDQRAGA